MKYILERVTQPTLEPVSLAELKRHLRCFADQTDEDGDITALGIAGREWAEDFTGRALVDQQWRLTIDQTGVLTGDAVTGYTIVSGYYSGDFDWISRVGEIMLRKSPVIAISSFKTVDSDGVETTVDAATYELREGDSKWPRIVPLDGATWTTANFRIVFRAGYLNRAVTPNTGSIPKRFAIAIKLWAEAHYDRDPANMQKLLDAAKEMIRPERVEVGFA